MARKKRVETGMLEVSPEVLEEGLEEVEEREVETAIVKTNPPGSYMIAQRKFHREIGS